MSLVDICISDEYTIDTWYPTRDYSALYKIEQVSDILYQVISFGTWEVVFTFPGMLGVQNFMTDNCIINYGGARHGK